MSGLLSFARAVPVIDGISIVFAQKGFDPGSKWYDDVLEEIDMGLENLTGGSNGVGNNNNVVSIIVFHGRDEANTNSH